MTGISEVTRILSALNDGNRTEVDKLWDLIYPEIHRLAKIGFARERSGHTLQATALVNEAFLKLADQTQVKWQGRTHFLSVAATIMRRVLVDHARQHRSKKRGGGAPLLQFIDDVPIKTANADDLLVIDETIEKLAQLDPRQAKIVELRFFAGMTVAEVAAALDVSERLVEAEWTMCRAWLRRALST